MKDIVIVGGGVSGLSAAIYAGRAELDAIMIEKNFPGGQIVNTSGVENYPGILEINGADLANVMYEHAKKFGTEIIFDEVIEIKIEGNVKKVRTKTEEYEAKVVILSMGANPRNLGVLREETFIGRGIGYCAICDGGFYRGKTIAVVGGGDTAVEDALYLSRIAKKVYLIHRRDELRANKNSQKKLFESNVEVIWNSKIVELFGEDRLNGIRIENINDNITKNLDVDGVFIAVGSSPQTWLVKDLVELNEQGYIVAGEDCSTSVDGVLAIGDIRTKQLRQVITAASDGAVSIYEAEKYIMGQEWEE